MHIVLSEYWKGLASSAHFPGMTLKQCLDKLHRDILVVWNFKDPEEVSQRTHYTVALRVTPFLKDTLYGRQGHGPVNAAGK